MDESILKETPALAVWWHLARSYILVTRDSDRLLARWGLTVPQFCALRVIGEAGGSLPLSHIGERLLVTFGNITGIVDRLEREGLVVRQRCPEDRRVVRAAITEKGREVSERAYTALIQHVAGLLEFMDPAERQDLARQLERVHLHLKERLMP